VNCVLLFVQAVLMLLLSSRRLITRWGRVRSHWLQSLSGSLLPLTIRLLGERRSFRQTLQQQMYFSRKRVVVIAASLSEYSLGRMSILQQRLSLAVLRPSSNASWQVWD
jgi:hypothetical protein